MGRLTWGDSGTRFFETGIDRGVLFIDDDPGVSWSGLTDVNEEPDGGESKPYYQDGFKYLNASSNEEYKATLSAFTYPEEFEACEGLVASRQGLYLGHQKRKPFSLSYRTMVGNDVDQHGAYKIHIVYNILAAPSSKAYKGISENIDPMVMSWDLTTIPNYISGYKPTAHLIIDSRHTDPSVLALVENFLYGDDENLSALPDYESLLEMFDTVQDLVVIDHGDGTWSATASFGIIQMTDPITFVITSPSAVFTDDTTYTLSSP